MPIFGVEIPLSMIIATLLGAGAGISGAWWAGIHYANSRTNRANADTAIIDASADEKQANVKAHNVVSDAFERQDKQLEIVRREVVVLTGDVGVLRGENNGLTTANVLMNHRVKTLEDAAIQWASKDEKSEKRIAFLELELATTKKQLLDSQTDFASVKEEWRESQKVIERMAEQIGLLEKALAISQAAEETPS